MAKYVHIQGPVTSCFLAFNTAVDLQFARPGNGNKLHKVKYKSLEHAAYAARRRGYIPWRYSKLRGVKYF